MHKDLIKKLRNDNYLTLETTPSKSATFNHILKRIEKLNIINSIDGFTTTDNPLAKLKYNSILAAIKLQQKFGKPVLATISMRDRNIIALQSDILGANDFDIRNFLVVTGDSAKLSDQPNAAGVFQGNSTELLKIIKYFNEGIDYAGKDILHKPNHINAFAVSNSSFKNYTTFEKKIHKKIENGAVGIITQPVYDLDNAKELLSRFEKITSSFSDDRKYAQLILGFFPITRLKTAQFLSAHVPGIYVPDSFVTKLFEAKKISEAEEEKVGFEMSRQLFSDLKKLHPKLHIMTANKFELVDELING